MTSLSWIQKILKPVLVCLLLASSIANGQYGGGNGDPNNPYLIYEPQHLQNIGADPNNWNRHFKLTADLDLTGVAVNPIGNEFTKFTGSFDGAGHTIANFSFNSPSTNYVGLFGWIEDVNAEIRNLGLENISVVGGNRVGGLCGFNSGGTISNCYVDANEVVGITYVGGLVGESSWLFHSGEDFVTALIERSYSAGNVAGFSRVGGLVGQSSVSETLMSFSNANTTGTHFVGGLFGLHFGHVAIANCYSKGSVNGQTNTGGLVGFSSTVNTDQGFNNCYSYSLTQGTTNTGGLIGNALNDDIFHNCFWDIEASGQATSDGGTGKTTAQMQDPNTFISVGWNFERPKWMICGTDYPRLIWYYPDINNSGVVNLLDFALLGAKWMSFDCAFCDGADLTGDQNVNQCDLLTFNAHWLEVDIVADHVFNIDIFNGWIYQDPNIPDDTVYLFELELATDESVELIKFLAPSGILYEIPKLDQTSVAVPGGSIETEWYFEAVEDKYFWLYEAFFSDPNSLDAYDDGLYTFTIYYNNGRTHETTVWFGIPDTSDPIPQPIQEPNFVSFEHGDQLTSPVTFTWQACTDPAADLIWVGVENFFTEEEEEFILPVNATGLPAPLDLTPGLYEVNIAFGVQYQSQNSDGIDIWGAKFSLSNYIFTVMSP